MIQSTRPLLYYARNGQKTALIEIEVKHWSVTNEGVTYYVSDYAVNGDVREFIGSEEEVRFRSWEQLNSLNDYLESIYDYTGMTKKEREFAKVQHGLLLETQTLPVYGSIASDWVLINKNII